MKLTWRDLIIRAGMEESLEWNFDGFMPKKERPTPKKVNQKQAWKRRGKK